MSEIAIRARHVSKVFGQSRVLDDVEFELRRGEVMCLAGENGCGKSTLIKIINGVYKPEPGIEFTFGDETLSAINPLEARSRGIHVIWQDLALFPHLTVAENIVFDDYVSKPWRPISYKEALKQSREIIQQFGLNLDPTVRVGDLSIAHRQLVAICRVLRAGASIIFMDEPTASLTYKEVHALLAITRSLAGKGISIVLVSHRLAEVLEVCQRVTVLRNGLLVGTYPTEGMTQARLSTLMTGLELEFTPRAETQKGTTVLELKQLSREGEFEDISFTLHRGEILGLTGLLGAGRTEIAHTIFGMTKPSSGEIYKDGQLLRLRSNRDAVRNKIAYLSEDRLHLGLVQNQSINMNSAVTVLPSLEKPRGFLSPRRIKALTAHWVEQLKTKVSDAELAVSSLSGGNQQRIALAKWLATKPEVLILDCPTIGVDVGAKAGIFDIIRDLADQGVAIILISDEAGEIWMNADRALVLREGRISTEVIPSETTEEALEAIINA
ncbi:sugar ABC transporter ATP-binding protein [Vreelandella profundi]|uniref:sugar ABC transporter ATP-binding protein n=1 Tax=Vreelandella profundi TaxID=2852117 RepID=UPI001EF145F5|nr:sugar ABC transporter ATP-binding protein [Halomonas profundi]